MKLRNLILFAAACALTPLAIHARTWTAVDGRTIEADFISASPTSVTIVRQPDGHKFTVPLERLCEADRTYVAKLLAWETARIKALTALQEAMPPPADPSNDSRQLWEKYRSAVRFIRPGTIAPHVKQLRQMIERDLAQLDIDGGARIGPTVAARHHPTAGTRHRHYRNIHRPLQRANLHSHRSQKRGMAAHHVRTVSQQDRDAHHATRR